MTPPGGVIPGKELIIFKGKGYFPLHCDKLNTMYSEYADDYTIYSINHIVGHYYTVRIYAQQIQIFSSFL